MSSGEGKNTRTGLYYFDRLGNLELLYRDEAISSMYPIPLAPRARPPTVASALDERLGAEGEFLLADVRRSFFPMPAGRAIRELRVFQVLPKAGPTRPTIRRLGHANAESARMLLGTVPVEADGSAYFRAPAGKPLYFQAVDEQGRAVQSMRSVTYLQPGERRGCVGCHEPPGSARPKPPHAGHAPRAPSRLQPGPEGSRPFSFPLLVQPVLDRHCVRCHDGQEGPGKSKLALTGEPAKSFSRSYDNLKPYLRWYEWGGASISQIATHPGHIGADESPLTRILDDATHRDRWGSGRGTRRSISGWTPMCPSTAPTTGGTTGSARRRLPCAATPSVVPASLQGVTAGPKALCLAASRYPSMRSITTVSSKNLRTSFWPVSARRRRSSGWAASCWMRAAKSSASPAGKVSTFSLSRNRLRAPPETVPMTGRPAAMA